MYKRQVPNRPVPPNAGCAAGVPKAPALAGPKSDAEDTAVWPKMPPAAGATPNRPALLCAAATPKPGCVAGCPNGDAAGAGVPKGLLLAPPKMPPVAGCAVPNSPWLLAGCPNGDVAAGGWPNAPGCGVTAPKPVGAGWFCAPKAPARADQILSL